MPSWHSGTSQRVWVPENGSKVGTLAVETCSERQKDGSLPSSAESLRNQWKHFFLFCFPFQSNNKNCNIGDPRTMSTELYHSAFSKAKELQELIINKEIHYGCFFFMEWQKHNFPWFSGVWLFLFHKQWVGYWNAWKLRSVLKRKRLNKNYKVPMVTAHIIYISLNFKINLEFSYIFLNTPKKNTKTLKSMKMLFRFCFSFHSNSRKWNMGDPRTVSTELYHKSFCKDKEIQELKITKDGIYGCFYEMTKISFSLIFWCVTVPWTMSRTLKLSKA